jgi:hypothetical protein
MATNREKWTNEFVKLVEELRAEQKKFFATKQQVHLIRSKQLEKEVDLNIKDFRLKGVPEESDGKQLSIFP